MKIEIKTTIEIEKGGIIIAPFYIDLYEFGFIQAGKAKEGYIKWSRHEKKWSYYKNDSEI